ILALIDALSDPDLAKRTEAFNQLGRYGPALWPILEREMPNQPPEARLRLERLLQNRITPSLGGMTLVDGRMRLLSRFDDGGALFYSDGGVRRPEGRSGEEKLISPAWICIRP